MKWGKRIGICLVLAFVLIAAFVVWKVYHFTPYSEPFDPQCREADTACLGWRDFRRGHPYPYQAFAAGQIDADTLVLVISEPGPALSKTALLDLVRQTFGPDLLNVERRRWYIAIDGWVEDLVLTLRTHGRPGPDPLAVPRLRDQVALLHQALFGTAFGGDLEDLGNPPAAGRTAPPAPALRVTAAEIASWIGEPALQWQPIDGSDETPQPWRALDDGRTAGAFASSDGALVILTFPTALVQRAKADPAALAVLRVPFREFAVSADAVFGGVWTTAGQTTLIARRRRTPLTRLPPLRFETFALLATQRGDELAQSFERTAVFAGKLFDGDDLGRDWAPIFLSPVLEDTEFGALLNMTDQMLKSWSSAGRTEYRYFDYPKPTHFPFKGRPIADIVGATGVRSVLFNWNTAGSAVVVKMPRQSILAVNVTTALPVTYGADGKTKAEGGADMLQYEEEAFSYFSGLGDPNLARVAQYTAIYQLFRAIARDAGSADDDASDSDTDRHPAARAVLAKAATTLIALIDSGMMQAKSEEAKATLARFADFRQRHHDLDAGTLGPILADRMSPASRATDKALLEEHDALVAEQVTHNADVERVLARDGDVSEAQAQAFIDRKAELERKEAQWKEAFEAWNMARADLAAIATATQDIAAVRTRFLRAADRTSDVSVKTPSSVLSWSRGEALEVEGGHNLYARTLVFEQSPKVTGIALEGTDDGRLVLRYDADHAAAVESRAGELARAVEHKGIRTDDELMAIIERPAAVRARPVALAIDAAHVPDIGSAAGFGRLGMRTYADKSAFVDDLRHMASENTCCIFVGRSHDETAYVTEVNLKPPPASTAYEARDTPSLIAHLKIVSERTRRERQRAIVFLDAPVEHVDALAQSVGAGGRDGNHLTGLADLFHDAGPPGRGTHVSAIFQRDLDGKPSMLRSFANTVAAGARALFASAGMPLPRRVWRTARTEVLDETALDVILQAAHWDKAQNGVPKAVQLTFHAQDAAPPDLMVIAGFGAADAPAGGRQLERAAARVLERAAAQDASIAQYLMTVRSELQKLPPGQLRQLIMVADQKEARALYTQLEQRQRERRPLAPPYRTAGGG